MSEWPATVIQWFENVPRGPRENDFYAPWNKLLYSLFSTDFVIEYAILIVNALVYIVKITSKAPGNLKWVLNTRTRRKRRRVSRLGLLTDRIG